MTIPNTSRAFVTEHGLQAFCPATGRAALIRSCQVDGWAIWWLCPWCKAGVKYGGTNAQAHCAVWLKEAEHHANN